MQTDFAEDQVSWFDPDSWCGKTSREHSPATKERTSGRSSKKLSGSGRRTLPTFHYLPPMADAWYGDGWSVAYRVLDAQFWGVPQRRRRIALVADFGGQAAPEILFERKGLCWYPAAGGEAGETAAGAAEDGTYPASIICLATQQGGAEIRTDDKAPTLTAAAGMSR